jgi:hypothetical protein
MVGLGFHEVLEKWAIVFVVAKVAHEVFHY